MLETIYDALAVPRNTLYVGLHAGIGAAVVGAGDPILVSDEVTEKLHLVPYPPAPERADSQSGRLDRIRAETERVSAMLADIFVDEEPSQVVPEPASEGQFMGLDTEHTALLTRLLTRQEWGREAFENAASEAGLMPGGAMETINEWAFDHHGDALLEDGDPVTVNRALLKIDPERMTAE